MNDTVLIERVTLVRLIELAREAWSQGHSMTTAQMLALRDAELPIEGVRYEDRVDRILDRRYAEPRYQQLAFDFGADFEAVDQPALRTGVADSPGGHASVPPSESAEQLRFDF